MALQNNTTLLVLMAMMTIYVSFSSAAVYSLDWAIGVDYTKWAANKRLSVGDVLLFHYSEGLHNVLVVKNQDYRTCNAASPIATYTSGSDSYTLRSRGDFFFICGFPGHCQAGQKLRVRVS